MGRTFLLIYQLIRGPRSEEDTQALAFGGLLAIVTIGVGSILGGALALIVEFARNVVGVVQAAPPWVSPIEAAGTTLWYGTLAIPFLTLFLVSGPVIVIGAVTNYTIRDLVERMGTRAVLSIVGVFGVLGFGLAGVARILELIVPPSLPLGF